MNEPSPRASVASRTLERRAARPFAVAVLAAISSIASMACSSSSETPTGGVDASGTEASAQDGTPGGSEACGADAGVPGPYDGGANDPRCPYHWTDLTDSAGIPDVCTAEGLVCSYPQGQAECAPDGPMLKWWPVGVGPAGCPQLPPALCTPCASPATVCGYISGAPPSDSRFVTNVCCDGNSGRWELEPGGGCPNGNTCGTIHAADYDQTCASNADCVAVTEGDLCEDGGRSCTNCANDAINVRAQDQYNADFAKRLSVPRVCPCPSGAPPTCNSGVCGLGIKPL